MAVSASEIVGGWRLLLCQSGINQYQRKFSNTNTPLFLQTPMPVRFTARVVPRALDPQTGDQNPNNNSSQEEDLWYVGKLAVGSFAGAAVIKYGSAVFPEITTPNLVAALIIITAPVLVAVSLLIKESRPKP